MRGYEENTLGPKDTPFQGRTRRRPLGGNIKVVGGAEMIFPGAFSQGFQTGPVCGVF